MMILIGVFQIIAGLVAIIDDDFYVVGPNYTFDLDVTAWGWIHLIIGIVVLLGGFALLQRKLWAAALGIGLAMLSAIRELLLRPLLPVLVDPDDRHRGVRDLVDHTAGRDRRGLKRPADPGGAEGRLPGRGISRAPSS